MGWLSKIFKKSSAPAPQRQPYSEVIKALKINETKILDVKLICDRFYKTQERYHVVSNETKIPEALIFAIHIRECSGDFKGCLANGERIIGTGKKTTLVPKGMGPYASWEESAIDELKRYSKPDQWNFEEMLKFAEKYNGMGYYNKGVASPYVLSWSNGYVKGKYVADGKFDPDFVDKQCGVAAILIGLGVK